MQTNTYYPFGMEILTLTENSTSPNNKNEYKYNGKMLQDELGLNWLDYGARFYDGVIGRWHVPDIMAEAHSEYTLYHYTFNNPLLFIDPIGLDTFNINVDDRSVNRTVVDNSESHTYIINRDGKVVYTTTLAVNEFGLVKFPNSGDGFGRYGTEDKAKVKSNNGKSCGDGSASTNEVNVGPGDHYLRPDAAAALFGLSSEMASKQEGAKIDYGDMSNAWGMAPGDDHKTHGGGSKSNFVSIFSGVCVDYRYLDDNYKSYWGQATDSQFNVIINLAFLNVAGKWGFNANYVSNKDVWKLGPGKATPNGKKIGGHNDHGHITYTK